MNFRIEGNRAFDSFLQRSEKALKGGRSVKFSEHKQEKRSSDIVKPVETGPLQEVLRPLFDKGEGENSSIGGHPDFQHLENTNKVEYGAITTLFVDMEGSTRLGLLNDPEQTFIYKDAIIRSAIEIIESFDGHVHRIMGDAVMAFFGRKGDPTETGVIDGVNCASTLAAFFESVVRPNLEKIGLSGQQGIRIGIDYGPEKEVLWSSYGMKDTSEVTATSFHVDVAAKLQENAGRNEVFIGQSLKEHIDFPMDRLLEIPERVHKGEKEKNRYVTPNYTGPDGQPINYRKYKLRWKRYLGWTALQKASGILDEGPKAVDVTVDVHESKRGQYLGETYPAGSRPLEKHKGLAFTFNPPKDLSVPYTVWTKVRNHGEEAEEEEQLDRDPVPYDVEDWQDQRDFKHWETTRYRGLHYLDFELRKGNTTHYSTRYGVYIK
jgi:class 3 adenylate cyclase